MKIGISEIFLSLQGEGKYIGTPHVFVRLAGCHIRCRWCDTDFSLKETLSCEDLLGRIKELYHPGCWISFTGGEPLLQAEELSCFLPSLKERKWPVYLETNGILAGPLKKVIDCVDVIAMDIKLPSSAGQGPFWKEHEEFLRAASAKEVFVKTVITPETSDDEFNRAVDLIARRSPEITLCLQPEHSGLFKGALEKCRALQRMAALRLKDVRVIPQVHKLMLIP
ncbi:MAG TPA: 7-carboxy-7-deazaguanine synthase QueE [Candidatus Omnitrophota bacterium]|nr:7-carboxy-7-deazaguanine synthase QueE [Candidatus Omnitrophota bacterium]